MRIRARLMESEIRVILADAVKDPREPAGLMQAILDRFGDLGGVELDLPSRSTPPRAADISA